MEHCGWSRLFSGNLLRVWWEGHEDGYLCRLKENCGEDPFLLISADHRFSDVLGFDPEKDSWEKVRQTCSRDQLGDPCPNCCGPGKQHCLFKSGEYNPPGFKALCSEDRAVVDVVVLEAGGYDPAKRRRLNVRRYEPDWRPACRKKKKAAKGLSVCASFSL
jgi:hypothetical protein